VTEAEIEARTRALREAKIKKMASSGRESLTSDEQEKIIAQVEIEKAEQPAPEPIMEALPAPTPPPPAPAFTRPRGRPRGPITRTPLPVPRLTNPHGANIAWIAAHNQLAKATLILEKIREDLDTLDPITRRFVAAQLHAITARIDEHAASPANH